MSDEMTDQERLSHLIEALWFYDGMPFVDEKIQMDIYDARLLIRLAQEAIIARQDK